MRRLGGDRGATAVEFALVAPVVLLLLSSLTFFAFRGVYSGLAANSARNALEVAVLPQGSSRTAIDPKEVYGAAVCAVPGALRPGADPCTDLRTVPVTTGFGVQVCPPDCTFEADVDTGSCAVALPAATTPGRVRALAVPGARVVPLSGTFGGLLPTATPTSTPALPSEPPGVPTATPSVAVPRVTASAEATLTPGVPLATPLPTPTPLPALTPLPVPSPLPPPPPREPTDRCLSDTAEGRVVIVRVTWKVPGLSGLLGLTGGVLSQDLATVSSTASGHRE